METRSALGTNWHFYTQKSRRCSQQMEIDGCNLHEEDAGCTKPPLLPTLCGMTINLMCVISTIQGYRPLLEKEIKKFTLSNCWGKKRNKLAIFVHSLDEDTAREQLWSWHLSTRGANIRLHPYNYIVWFSACLAAASVQLVFTMLGHRKGEEQ